MNRKRQHENDAEEELLESGQSYYLEAADGVVLPISKDAMHMSDVFSRYLSQPAGSGKHVFPVQRVHSQTLRKIVMWCEKNSTLPPNGIPPNDLEISEEDRLFLKMDGAELVKLVNGVDYLDVKRLSGISKRAVVEKLRDMTVNEIVADFQMAPSKKEEAPRTETSTGSIGLGTLLREVLVFAETDQIVKLAACTPQSYQDVSNLRLIMHLSELSVRKLNESSLNEIINLLLLEQTAHEQNFKNDFSLDVTVRGNAELKMEWKTISITLEFRSTQPERSVSEETLQMSVSKSLPCSKQAQHSYAFVVLNVAEVFLDVFKYIIELFPSRKLLVRYNLWNSSPLQTRNIETISKWLHKNSACPVDRFIVRLSIDSSMTDFHCVARRIKSNVQVMTVFSPPLKTNVAFNCAQLHIDYSMWFLMSSLMATKCPDITLKQSKFVSSNLSTYVKKWMKGKTPPSHQLLNISLKKDAEQDEIFEGIPANCIERDCSGVHVKRSDGQTMKFLFCSHNPKDVKILIRK